MVAVGDIAWTGQALMQVWQFLLQILGMIFRVPRANWEWTFVSSFSLTIPVLKILFNKLDIFYSYLSKQA